MDELAALLDEQDPVQRRRAVAALSAPPALDVESLAGFLLRGLGDDDYGVRQEVARLCQRWGPAPFVLSGLERALRDEESLARRAAAMEAFGHLGEPAVPVLTRLATDPRAGVRRLAVDALGLTQSPRAFGVLSRAGEDESPAVRSAALEALSRTGAPGAAERILAIITRTGEAASVALSGLLALEGLGAAIAAHRLRPFLLDSLTAPPALRLLGRAGDVELLASLLASATGARQRAALGGLVEALSRDPTSTREALERRGKEVLVALDGLLGARDAGVAGHALLVAAQLGQVEAFARAAARPDSAELLPIVHRALTASVLVVEETARRLDVLAQDAPPGAEELLRELAQSVRERLTQRGGVSVASPRVAERSSEQELDARSFDALAALVRRRAGLLFEPHMAYRIEARLLPRVRALGTTWLGYVALLGSGSDEGEAELQTALERVTVHETYFYRERPQLEAFVGELLPVMLGQADGLGGNPLVHETGLFRVWSAGCSTGEEAWTLAMLLEETGSFEPPARDFEVVGSDLSTAVIATAKAGHYGARSFRGDLPDETRARCFEPGGAQLSIAPALRSHVRFAVANLVEPRDLLGLGRFHVIFCRNVLIYMSREARTRILKHLYERLRPGGVLFLGHSESLLHVETEFRLLPLQNELVYIKPGAGPFQPVTRARRLRKETGGGS